MSEFLYITKEQIETGMINGVFDYEFTGGINIAIDHEQTDLDFQTFAMVTNKFGDQWEEEFNGDGDNNLNKAIEWINKTLKTI